MSEKLTFGSLSEANEVREEYDEHLCVDDDRRLKTVEFASSTPDDVLDQLETRAAASRGARQSGPGQVGLTDSERNRVDWSRDGANIPKYRSIKGIASEHGVDDWLSYVDPSLTVDEHRTVMQEAKRDEQGQRMDAEQTDEERAEHLESQRKGGECNHARNHCEHGEPAACEFLRETCGYDEEEIGLLLGDKRDVEGDDTEQQELVTVGGGEFPAMDVTPEQAGALHRSWQGYKGAVARLDGELSDVREAVINARQAIRAINAIRDQHGQDELHPDRLHDLLSALESMPGDIREVRTLDHFSEDTS